MDAIDVTEVPFRPVKLTGKRFQLNDCSEITTVDFWRFNLQPLVIFFQSATSAITIGLIVIRI